MVDFDRRHRLRKEAAEHFEEFDADDFVVQEHRNALILRLEDDANLDSDGVSDWWDCPKCGAPTRVSKGPRLPTKRACSECDWSFTFPESSGGDADVDE